MTHATSDQPRPGTFVAALCLGLVFALGLANYTLFFKTPMLETGDIAANALQVDHAKHLGELYGNYSRFEFNHPGPAFFYVYAAGEWVLHDRLHLVPSPANAHLITCLALQSLFFALALAVFCTHLPGRALPPLALLTAALHFGPLHEAFVSIWPPHVLLMPFLCFLTACASVGSGRVRHLSIAVLAGGFLFHGHVAQPLFVGSLGGLALGLCAWQLRPGQGAPWAPVVRAYRSTLVACVALAFVFLLPLAIDVLTRGTRSNVATILGRFYANTGDVKTAWQSLLYFLSFATASRDQETLFTTLGPQVGEFFSHEAWRVAAWVAVFIIPTLLAWLARKRLPADERRFLLVAGGFLAACVAVCILWGKAQAGPMTHFNSYFYYGIYYFALLLGLGLVARFFDRFVTAAVSALLCACSAVILTWTLQRGPITEAEAGLPIARGVEAALKVDAAGAPKLLVFEHANWPEVAAVALALQRHHLAFGLEPWWSFMFQSRHDVRRFGPAPEDHASIWWITKPGPGGTPLTPDLSIYSQPAPISPDKDEIRFHGGDNGFRYVVYGLSAGNVDFAWTELPNLVVRFAPQPAARDVRVVFDAQSADASPVKQPAEVFFNGQPVGRVAVKERAEVSVTVSAALWNRQATGTLELRFAQAVSHRQLKRPDYEWWNAWGLWKIRFEAMP